MADPVPKVSVCVITFNHERWVRRCLDSILSQHTAFAFEVIVGDDCSTDATAEILREYRERYPSQVRLVLQERRTGGAKNYEDVHALARGEYVAHVDGDDELMPGKLQRQCDVMDRNDGINISWHRVVQRNERQREAVMPRGPASFLDALLTRADLVLYGPFGAHSSTMYRRTQFHARNVQFEGNDWFISVELIGSGYGVMLSDVLGVYRIHGSGLSQGSVANQRTRALLCRCQREVLRLHPELRRTIALRALAVAVFDALSLKRYFTLSMRVLLACRALPDFAQAGRLLEFLRASRLPKALIVQPQPDASAPSRVS